MKVPHKINGWSPDRTDPRWAERVEREAEATTNQAQARWEKAQRRFAKARFTLDAAELNGAAEARLTKLRELVADRLAELQATERMMRSTLAGSQNRGKGSHRGVARGEVL